MPSPLAPKSLLSPASNRPASLDRRYVGSFVEHLFGASLHKKRLDLLANSVVGVLHAAMLAIHAIGAAYAAVAQKHAKHGITQVDRWLSNPAFDVARLWSSWVEFVVGVREEIVIALDWTDFERDDHTTLCAYLVTRHGRATPLMWRTVPKSTLEGKRTGYEHELIETLHGILRPEKEAWCLATSLAERKAQEEVKLYGKRFTIEETFRDEKDIHFGLGLSATHIKSCERRDRLLLLVALAHALLTLLGAASEETGLDRTLKANTSKKRSLSLFRQGLYWYHAIPAMRDDWLEKLMVAFNRIVEDHRAFREVFAVI